MGRSRGNSMRYLSRHSLCPPCTVMVHLGASQKYADSWKAPSFDSEFIAMGPGNIAATSTIGHSCAHVGL